MRENIRNYGDVKDEPVPWAKILREFRKEHKLSRIQAAKAWGLSWRTWEGWELGRSNPAGLYRERLEGVLKKVRR